MPAITGFVGVQSLNDSSQAAPVRLGRNGDLMASGLHGKYYEQSRRGAVFTASTVIAGVVIPTAAATLNSKFTFWNPAGTAKVAEIISIFIGCDTVTTVAGNNGILLQANLTGTSGIPTTVTTPCSAIPMGATVSASKMTVAAQATLTNVAIPGASGSAVPIAFYPLQNYGAVTDTVLYDPTHRFDGELIVYPDSLIAVCASVAPSTAAFISIQWAEYDA